MWPVTGVMTEDSLNLVNSASSMPSRDAIIFNGLIKLNDVGNGCGYMLMVLDIIVLMRR
jgi:hypothetical protein